jgi:hypothetical protein
MTTKTAAQNTETLETIAYVNDTFRELGHADCSCTLNVATSRIEMTSPKTGTASLDYGSTDYARLLAHAQGFITNHRRACGNFLAGALR